MNQKTLSIISYITIIGWAVSYFSSNEGERSPLLIRHLQQSFGLGAVSLIVSVAISILAFVVPALGMLSLINFLFFVLMILGIINAANEKEADLPIIGKLFDGKFAFIR